MGQFLLRWVVLVAALIVSAALTQLVFGAFGAKSSFGINVAWGTPEMIGDLGRLFVGAGILSLVNATLGPLLRLVTVPLNCLTLGLVSVIINAGLFWLVGEMRWGFTVNDFFSAFVGVLLFSAANALLVKLVVEKEDKNDAKR